MLSMFKGFLGNEPPRTVNHLSHRLEKLGIEQTAPVAWENVVDTARELRDTLVRSTATIKRSEKIRLLKLINKVKVRALLRGDTEGYRAFSALDSIGSDLLRAF